MVAESQVSAIPILRCFLGFHWRYQWRYWKFERCLLFVYVSRCDCRALPDAGIPVEYQPLHTFFCQVSNGRLIIS